MAYPTVDTPYGFKPINRFDGMPYAGATNQYPVTSGQAVYNGQVVAFVNGGTVSPVALTSARLLFFKISIFLVFPFKYLTLLFLI